MHAILITPDTIDKIKDTRLLTLQEFEALKRLHLHRNSVFITGFVPRIGPQVPWTILPDFMLEEHFEYNPLTIRTDWDQIVRLHSDENTTRLPYKE